MRVLILSSSMGAGHDGAGRELIRRLEAQGHEARMHDYLDALPLRVGHLVRFQYQLQLRFAPWSYENSYHMMPRIYGLLVWLNSVFARPKLRRWMRAFGPDVVVSNNPLATLAIGRLRERNKLTVPAVTYVTDFGVHPLWIHQGIDLHLTVHPQAAAEARRRAIGGDVRAPGPLVGERFRGLLPDRRLARSRLGLNADDRAVLVVAGSWGVGAVEETARLLRDSGRFVPITVCGRDEQLRARMESDGVGVVIGWTDDMPSLMAAADALVENAGGLTCMEAFAAGLPVVTFNPIPGHGRDNADAMVRAGVSSWPATQEDLLEILSAVTAPGPVRARFVDAASAMFAGDAATEVLSVAEPVLEPVLLNSRRRRVARRLAGVAAATAAVYATMTAGVAVAADHGLLVAADPHPGPHVTVAGVRRSVAYVGVRLSASELADPAVQGALVSLRPTVIVTSREASLDRGAVASLSSAGLDVATGGCGRPHTTLLPEELDTASAHVIRNVTGVRPSAFVPARPLDALDLLWAGRRHLDIVVPRHTVVPGRPTPHLDAGQSYVIDGLESTSAQLVEAMTAMGQTAASQGSLLASLTPLE